MTGWPIRLNALRRNKTVLNVTSATAIGLAVALVAMFMVDNLSFLTSADRFVQDWEIAFRTPPEKAQDPNIRIIALDEQAMQHFPYRSPLDRGFLAELLTTLDASRPRVIFVDYLFDQPTEKTKDDKLFRVLRELKTPLVVSYFETGGRIRDDQVKYLEGFVPKALQATANLGTDQTDTARWINPGVKTASGRTILSVPRRVARLLGIATRDERVPIVWRADPGPREEAFSEISACRSDVRGACVPVTDFSQAPNPLFRKFMEAAYRGKVVLIGSDLTLVDQHRTPFATDPGDKRATMPGVKILAHAIAQLIEHREPPQLSWWQNFLVALLLAGLGAALGLPERSLWLRAGAVVALIAALWAIGVFVLYEHMGVMIGLIAPSIAVVGAFAAVDSVTGLDARRQRAFIHNSFSRYLPPSFVQQLVDDPDKLVLGGERREIGLLFTDIQGFTTMSEHLDPKDVGRLLNDYLDGMTAAVQAHEGTIDKFIGDSVFAIWNAPLDIADYHTKLVRCALDMDAFAEDFRKRMNAQGIPLGITRIGVHSGAAAVGNFGSRVRLSYTASGDAVNAASRLEGLNKTFGTRLCVSDATRVLCHGIAFRPIGSVILKGKTEALDVWEPLHEGAMSDDYLARYRAAFQKIGAGEPCAVSSLTALAEERPDDPLVAFYLERLKEGEGGIKIKMTEK